METWWDAFLTDLKNGKIVIEDRPNDPETIRVEYLSPQNLLMQFYYYLQKHGMFESPSSKGGKE